MRIIDSPSCIICNEIDNLPHFLYHCGYIKAFWASLISWLNNDLNYSIIMNEKNVIFGIHGTNDHDLSANYVILHAKYFIYRSRIQEIYSLQLISFKSLLKHELEIEKMISDQRNPSAFTKYQL